MRDIHSKLIHVYCRSKNTNGWHCRIKKQPVLSIFYPTSMEIYEESEDIVDLMVLTLKHKGNTIDESGEERTSRKRIHLGEKLVERVVWK